MQTNSIPSFIDDHYMQLALALAKRGLGRTAPNPTVGCIIVQGSSIVGRGVTAKGGRPHAETIALSQAGKLAEGAMVYVTLEPCSHHGHTPPCAQALIDAKVARVVIATKDSHKAVSGRGIEMLKDAGIAVTIGIGETEARLINEGFFKVHEVGRPMVTLKVATTLDGHIAMSNGESKWITGEASRRYTHVLRAQHDAIMVGINTVKADNPELTCRLPGLAVHSPVRIVIDSQLAIPNDAKLIATAHDTPSWIITTREHTQAAFPPAVKVHSVAADSDGRVDMKAALSLLAGQGITRVLVEGGATLAASLLKAKLVDRLVWFRAPKVIGSTGLAAVGALDYVLLKEVPQFERESVRTLGEDVVEVYRVL